MSTLSNSEFEKIISNKLSLDFAEAVLRQHKKFHAREYAGAASIWQDDDGFLRLKFYCRNPSSGSLLGEMMEDFNGTAPSGQIISLEKYFQFEGRDMSGRFWTADHIYLSSNANMSTGDMVFQAARIRSIRSGRQNSQPQAARAVVWVKGQFKIPFNQGQPEATEPAFSKCEIRMDEERATVFRTAKENLVVVVTPGSEEPVKLKNRILEAVGIAVGALLRPQIELIVHKEMSTAIVYSLESKQARSNRLVPPIPTSSPDDFGDFRTFVNRYLSANAEPYKEIAGFWFRVLSGFHNSAENQGLIVATACEGVIRACFEADSFPDAEFQRQCEEAREIISKLSLEDRAKSRVLQSLAGAKDGTMANALRQMESDGRLPTGFRAVWQGLRNKLAHASELNWDGEKTQKFVNELYSCLELFYRLIMLSIGYDGRLNCYSRFDWPVALVSET